jgi:hypothetical protein
LGDPLKGKLAAVLQTSALGGPTLSTGKEGERRHHSPLYSDFHDFTLSRRVGQLTLESRLKKSCSIQPGTEPGFHPIGRQRREEYVSSILVWYFLMKWRRKVPKKIG